MARRDYNRLGVVDFGVELLRSGDLDPVYLALNGAGFDEAQKLRWLAAYCAFYHCGVASWMSEWTGREFWDWMFEAGRNSRPSPVGERWPRGRERRHFRGAQGLESLADWRARAALPGRPEAPERMFAEIAGPLVSASFRGVVERASKFRGVGPWMAFKVADLVDAAGLAEVDQSDLELALYKTPRESLLRMFREEPGLAADRRNLLAFGREDVTDGEAPEREAIRLALDWLAHSLRAETIPHKPGRPVDLFCLETVACKHLSHLHGHYPLRNDTEELLEGLRPWASVSFAASSFLAAAELVG